MSLLAGIIGSGGGPNSITMLTVDADNIASTSARLSGIATPDSSGTMSVYLQYGTVSDLSIATLAAADSSPITATAGTAYDFYKTVTGLTPNTTYYFRAVAENNDTAPGYAFGQILSFITSP